MGMKKMRDEFDGFSIHLLQDESGDFVAHFVELPNVSACGYTAEEALSELKEAWEAMKESYLKHNEPIPNDRPMPELQSEVETLSKQVEAHLITMGFNLKIKESHHGER
jgi:predicted RNase H-like HicB family nuclease